MNFIFCSNIVERKKKIKFVCTDIDRKKFAPQIILLLWLKLFSLRLNKMIYSEFGYMIIISLN